jgi:L-phenylalanine/L-methionine N-acetyltransferase
MKKRKMVQLLAEHDGKIIGSCSIDHSGNPEANMHIGHYGICILQKYTGCGIGTKLTESAIKIAGESMKIEMLQLRVHSKNRIAMNLYKKTGFKYCGKIPKGIKNGNKYQDDIIMYKVLK